MKHKLHTLSAVMLILAFGLSNVGLPIVMYFCPMMPDQSAQCDMVCNGQSENLAIVNQNPPCCSTYIVAERNTTPFVKVEKSAEVTLTAQMCSLEPAKRTEVLVLQHVTYSSSTAPPLFLLNSALLI